MSGKLLRAMMTFKMITDAPIRNFFAILLILLLAMLLPNYPAYSESLLPYQPLDIRHVCAPTQVGSNPGQSPKHRLNSGNEVQLLDITFGPDNVPYFAIKYATGTGLQVATGYVPIDQVFNFCNFENRAEQGHRFLAPPNTCHLIAVETSSLQALNKEALALEKFLSSMTAYRMGNGNYALSLGLLNIRASKTILQRASGLPQGSQCVTGTEFVEALSKKDKVFSEEETGRFSSEADRMNTARELMQKAVKNSDATNFKLACALGYAEACSRYAESIYNIEDPHGTLPATVTDYALLGCMGGNALGCKLAINRAENTLENAQFRALDGGTRNPNDLVGLELAKPGCDARQAVSCIILARGTATYTTPTLVEAASNFAAKFTACRSGIAWSCEELQDAFAQVVQARKEYASATANENYSLGSLVEEYCITGPAKPNVAQCKPAYLKYRDFLQTVERTTAADVRIAKAKSLLERGCTAGDPSACAAQTRLSDHWSTEARNVAATRAVDLCAHQTEKDSVCDGLGAALDPELNGAKPAQRDVYNALVVKCMTDKTSNGPQACSSAVTAYAALEGNVQTDTVEIMLAGACTGENINGCQALASLLSAKSQDRSPENKNYQAVLSALRTGCQLLDSPANTCVSLAEALTLSGENNAAMNVYARACEYQIKHTSGRLTDVSICYDAVKFSLTQKLKYADALIWSDFACRSEDIGLSPYACKLLGNIYASGLGVEENPQEAGIAYQNGCFHPFVKTTDGESCIKYATILLQSQDQLKRTGQSEFTLPEDEYDETQSPERIVAEASRAYDMGCMDNIEQACQLNRKLLDDWSKGQYPHNRAHCRVQNDLGSISSEKICREFSFYQAAGQLKEQRRQTKLEVYVWPDGDRTVVYQKDGAWLLNEVTTDGVRRDGATRCWRNPISKKSFCVEAFK